jgi:hypothetical protein
MENRAAAPASVAGCLRLAAAALVLGCGPGAPAAGLAAGDRSPELLGGGVRVAWVVREDDLLGCRHSARELRALKARYGSSVPIDVVVVGENEGLAPGFLRRERLDATLVEIDLRTYREQFGGTGLPLLLVVDRGSVRAVWKGSPEDTPAGRAVAGELAEVVGTILPGRRTSPNEPGRGA